MNMQVIKHSKMLLLTSLYKFKDPAENYNVWNHRIVESAFYELSECGILKDFKWYLILNYDIWSTKYKIISKLLKTVLCYLKANLGFRVGILLDLSFGIIWINRPALSPVKLPATNLHLRY